MSPLIAFTVGVLVAGIPIGGIAVHLFQLNRKLDEALEEWRELARQAENAREDLINRVREIQVEISVSDVEQERAAGGARTLWKRKVDAAEKRLVRELVQENLITVEVRDDPDWMARRCQIRLRTLASRNQPHCSYRDLPTKVFARAGISRNQQHPDEPLDPEDLARGEMGDRGLRPD